ncbi:LysR family transcriptional regulator [Niveispirillum fermenti]|uniref:LysR family transcriptional regulator n=1 Tax=Niveispirillum fermenti TaxID=1233113 RepID=UPI003A86B525
MDALSLDQFAVFVTVADTGSFSAAARRLNRVQSAITYTIARLEDQVQVALFDRSGYRPVPTPAGTALLPQARRILAELDAFRSQAAGLSRGLEAELSIVIETMAPMALAVEMLAALRRRYPSVRTRVLVETLGAASGAVIGGAADIGILTAFASDSPALVRVPVGEISLVPVAAPAHPLARAGRPLETGDLRDHLQLVLTDRSEQTAGRDHGVAATSTWRIADLGAKHALLLAGVGWGSMPAHMVAGDLTAGRLVELAVRSWDGAAGPPRLPLVAARRADAAAGPAGRWFMDELERRSPASRAANPP